MRKKGRQILGVTERRQEEINTEPLIIVLWVCVIGADLLAIRAESQKCIFKKEGKKV